MVSTFNGGAPWPAITAACRTAGPRFAAIAYLGLDAPRLMPLKSRDTLVVNSGRAALESHATNPDALQYYLDRGVKLYEHDRLHAKVLATKTTAVIGSANASNSSTLLAEAVVVTDSMVLVRQVREFVAELVEKSTIIDQDRIEWARHAWAQGRGGGLLGSASGVERRFPTNLDSKVYLLQDEPYEPSAAVRLAITGSRRQAQRRAGPAQEFEVSYIASPVGDAFSLGDLVVFVDNGNLSLWEIDSDPIKAGARKVINWMRKPTGHKVVSVADARARLGYQGAKVDFRTEGCWIRGADLRAALVGLWHPGD